jgi:hypothetical protein
MPPKGKKTQNVVRNVDKTLTPLAKIYGHPPGKDENNKATLPDPTVLTKFSQLKSGLTPISAETSQTRTERKNIQELQKYQRNRFRGQLT